MQKHTIKLLLKKNKKNSLDLYPIYLRITINRKTSFISTGYTVPKNMWDDRNEAVRETHPTYEQINTDILSRKREVLDKLVLSGVKKQSLTSAAVKVQANLKETHSNLFAFADLFIKELHGKRSEGTFANYEKHLKKLEEFNGSRQLKFEEINPDYLARLESHLRATVKRREGTNAGNYIGAIIKTIKTFFNAARKKKITSHYPFGEYESPKAVAGDKEYLTLAELDKWEKYCDEGKYKEAAVWFMFGCLTGLRVSDWYRFDEKKHLKNGVLVMQTQKTKGWAGVPLYDRLRKHLNRVRALPVKTVDKALARRYKEIAKELKIGKHLSHHSARKTFAVTLCLERGISSETAAAMMAITLDVFVKNYSRINAAKVKGETAAAWANL